MKDRPLGSFGAWERERRRDPVVALPSPGPVAEAVDAANLKFAAREGVPVRVRAGPPVPEGAEPIFTEHVSQRRARGPRTHDRRRVERTRGRRGRRHEGGKRTRRGAAALAKDRPFPLHRRRRARARACARPVERCRCDPRRRAFRAEGDARRGAVVRRSDPARSAPLHARRGRPTTLRFSTGEAS